ncbi:MAG: NACHT domain-containing protein [Rhabdochlamydiaceae bacterium]|nr:NACHT domain-containing protein [Rhabdochlamydiaceae bacterium]
MHNIQQKITQEIILSGLNQKFEKLQCDPSIPVKFGILGNYEQTDFINQLQSTLQKLPETDLVKRIATVFNDYVAVVFYPNKGFCTEMWVFESFQLATPHITRARSTLKKADSIEKLRKALNCFREALKIQKHVGGNVLELENAILEVSKKLFVQQNQYYPNDYLAIPDEIARYHETIKDFQTQENIFEALLTFVDNSPEQSRSAASYLLKAISHEFLSQPLLAADNFAVLFEKNLHHPQVALNCLKKAVSYFDQESRLDTLDYPSFLEKLNRSALMEVLEKTHDNDLQNLLNEKDAIRMVFDRMLVTLAKQSSSAPSCFICFDPEEAEIAQWLGQILIGDLETASIHPISTLRNLSYVDDFSDFQKKIRESDHVIVVCTPSLKNKCDQNREAPGGVAQEVRFSQERYRNPTKNREISLLYLEGDRTTACPSSFFEPVFASQYSPLDLPTKNRVFNYYNIVFELIGSIKKVSNQTVHQIKSLFIEEVRKVLNQEIDQKALEEWRSTPFKRKIVMSATHETQGAHRKFSLTEAGQAQEVIAQLRAHYTAKKCITLLIPQEHKEILIEQLYTRLAIIGDQEKKEKKKELAEVRPVQDVVGYGIMPTHESIFEPKETIKLEKLFELEKLKGKAQKRVLIQGSAGIGKSMLCHHMAFMWAKGELFTEFEYLFWLPLRSLNTDNYKHEGSLEAFLAKECQVDPDYIRSFLRHERLKGKTLILLDGYDELSPDAVNPKGVLNPVLKELKEFPNVLITTRPQHVDFTPDCNFEILGFDAKDVEKYIGRFFPEEQKEQAQELRQELKKTLVRSLARIPINLEIFCSLVAVREPLFGSTEASSTTSLYIRLTGWLFKQLRANKSLQLNDLSEVEESDERHLEDVDRFAEALEDIAWQAMEQNTLYFPEPQFTQLFREIGKKITLKDVARIGPLRIEEKECFFIHLTFQEFFAAAKLARLYTTDRERAKECLKKIKLEPRYMLVLKMVAGCLSLNQPKMSKQTKTHLQLFFDDLFSEPHDLAISYDLRMKAYCFEECKKPENISQYNSFIEQIVKFLNTCPNQQLIVNLLTGNSKLISQKEVAAVFRNQIQHPQKQLETLVTLRQLAENGQALPPEVLAELCTCLSNLKVDRYAKSEAAEALGVVVRGGQALPTEAFQALIACLSDPKVERYAKSRTAEVLGAAAKSGQASAAEALAALIACLSDPKVDPCAKSEAAQVLGTVARSGQALPFEAFQALIVFVFDPKIDSYDKLQAARTFAAVVRSGQALPTEVFQALIACLSDSEVDVNVKFKIAKALRAVARSGQASAAEALAALIACLSDPKIDIAARFGVAEVLVVMAQKGQVLPPKAFQDIITLLSDPDGDSEAISFIAKELGAVAKSSQTFPPEALQALIACLSDPTKKHVRYEAAEVLEAVAKRGQALPSEVLQVFIACLSDPKMKHWIKSRAAKILGAVAKRGQALPLEAVAGLIACLFDPKIEFDGKFGATTALGAMEKRGQVSLADVLATLIARLSDPMVNGNAKSELARALGAMAKSGQALTSEAFQALIACLFDPTMDYNAKSEVVGTLGTVAWSGQTLPSEAFAALIACLFDPKANQPLKFKVGHAFMAVAKRGQAFPSEALQGLIACVSDPTLDYDAKTHVAEALAAAAKSDQALPSEVLTALSACLSNPKVDSKSKFVAFEGLKARIQSGQALPPEAFQILIASLFSDIIGRTGKPLPSMYNAKLLAAKVLAEVARSGQALPAEAFQALIACLSDPKVDGYTKSQAGQGLGAMAKRGHILPSEAFAGLTVCLSGSEIDSDATFLAAEALGTAAKSGQALPPEAIAGLIACLSDPKVDSTAKSQAAKTLGIAAKTDQPLSLEALGEIIQALDMTSDSDTKTSILDFLGTIIENQSFQLNNKNYKLLAKLFFLTGHPLFYREERFYTTSKQNKISTNEKVEIPINQGVDPSELYQKLVRESIELLHVL